MTTNNTCGSEPLRQFDLLTSPERTQIRLDAQDRRIEDVERDLKALRSYCDELAATINSMVDTEANSDGRTT